HHFLGDGDFSPVKGVISGKGVVFLKLSKNTSLKTWGNNIQCGVDDVSLQEGKKTLPHFQVCVPLQEVRSATDVIPGCDKRCSERNS
ncbi:hypothetical protein C0J52_18561, partial [Blattella germanica]